MSIGGHSFVAFYPQDWRLGTMYLPPFHRLIYMELCCYMWDKNEPVPECILSSMFHDIPGFEGPIEDLIAIGKIMRDDSGSLFNLRALSEASKAFKLWQQRSKGGSNSPKKTPRKSVAKSVAKTPLSGSGSGSGSGSSLPVSKRDTPITHDDLGNVIKLNGGKA